MKKLWIAVLTLALLFVSTVAMAQSVGFGFSYLNCSTRTECLSPIVTTDIAFRLDHSDAFAEYAVQLHQDEVFRQQLRLGPILQWRGITPFYQLDQFQGARYSGGGLMVKSTSGRNAINLSGLYREEGYGFSAKCATERGPVTGSIGYGYDKYGDWVVQGPQFGVRW